MTKLEEHAELAAKAGFTTAAEQAPKLARRAGRLAMAYERFRFVSEEKIAQFNRRLYQHTVSRSGMAGYDLTERCDQLRFTPIANYPSLPPAGVLKDVAAAQDLGVFDALEVADIQSVVEYKDPLVFGRINGCTDRFFIAQWGDDVRITDLLGEHDG